MKVYDNYEISPCRQYEEPDSPGKFYFEVCKPEEADVWTLYGHINGKGVEAIGDFPTRDAAVQVYSRITGQEFTASYEADAHLRVMHAGAKLLEASTLALRQLREFYLDNDSQAILDLKAAIAEATGGAPSAPPKPIVIEVRGGVVQDVLNVPPGFQYEVKDYDNIEVGEEDKAKAASTSEPTNQQRARWARAALAVFTAETFSGDDPDTMDRDDLESAIGDLICDLLHFAVQQGFDPQKIVETAEGHHAIEIMEEASA